MSCWVSVGLSTSRILAAVVISKPACEVACGFWVGAVEVAAFHPASHQGSISVLDDQVGCLSSPVGLFLHHLLPTSNGLVVFISFQWFGNHVTITHDKVGSDDHTDIIHFKSLAGMDATDLIDRVLRDDPQTAVLIQIPLALVFVADNNISRLAIFLLRQGQQ